ncbi:1,4-alpha-glucan branching protein GlgB [Peterkaempfera sp. SMS 1(5)a]|uniref:1,4-alpha-glucan branching protein GlgB n=1 Tax=Peterkaempfera podocarpi TaxID=3232308 RepID=UPI00366F4459
MTAPDPTRPTSQLQRQQPSVVAPRPETEPAPTGAAPAGPGPTATPPTAAPTTTAPAAATTAESAASGAAGSGATGSGATGSSPAGSAGSAASAASGRPAAAQPGRGAAAPAEDRGDRASEPIRLPEAPLAPGEIDRLVAGSHHDPHGLLGAHPVPGGVAVRVLRPMAERVVVETPIGRAELVHQHEGLFTGLLPVELVPDYRLRVTYSGTEYLQDDGYRFLPTLGEMDLHLIREGRHEQLWEVLGSHVRSYQTGLGTVTGVSFAVWAPNAVGVRLVGDFNGWNGCCYPMRSLGSSGVWELFVPGMTEGTRYKYEIRTRDGRLIQKGDPLALAAECPPGTASVVHRSQYEWGDAEWMAAREAGQHHREPMSVYEVHLPSWRPGLSYRELAEVLPEYITDLGFTHVEFLPVMEHPFGGSWGYQVSYYYAPTARMGGPDDFRFLVDALHRAGIGVIVDWVPAHFPKDDFALARYDGEPLYEPADPQRAEHPDWGTLEFDYGRTEVRNFLVANAVYWCQEYHVDGLRVDAVASMLYLDYSREYGQWSPNQYGGRENLDAVTFLQEMNATVYRRCPGAVTIAEESTAWDGVTRPTHDTGPTGIGGLGFGLKWNMGWMHDSLLYMSKDPVHRRYHHNDMTFSMVYAYSENYILPISHDEVVHGKGSLVSKMPGDWWQQRANLRAYLAFMWSHPGKQLLFMGQEFAQGAEFDHDTGPQWWVLDKDWPASDDHRGVQELVRSLNRVYRDVPALWERDTEPEGFSWLDGGAAEDNVFSFVRYDRAGRPLVVISNFSPVVRHGYRVGLPQTPAGSHGLWTEVLNTDAAAYGGSGVGNPDPVKAEADSRNGRDLSAELVLPPLATLWLRPA